METKISKAQLEVWEWKSALHEEIKEMELDKGLDFLLNKAERVAAELKKVKKLNPNAS